jgi:hypothetical protein
MTRFCGQLQLFHCRASNANDLSPSLATAFSTQHHCEKGQKAIAIMTPRTSPHDATFTSQDLATLHVYCARYEASELDRFRWLSNYIHRAEDVVRSKYKRHAPIFSHHSAVPRLSHGKVNRILVFSDCFNPPHLHHLELLMHNFLRNDRYRKRDDCFQRL